MRGKRSGMFSRNKATRRASLFINHALHLRRFVALLLFVGHLSAEDVTIRLPAVDALRVTKPPAELALDPFYEKYISADGYPIVSSGR
jgi:hypothetical protein